MEPTYEITAVRYARSDGRRQTQNFLYADDHDGEVSPLDFYIFVAQGGGRTFVIDTGFDPESGAQKNRAAIRSPVDALKSVGIDASSVEDVILTHMHWDHAGGMRYFPKARFHIQDAEMEFCTGRCMCHSVFRKPFNVEHVVYAVRALFDDRLVFHDGDYTLAPGITVHRIGGHTPGLQVLRIRTKRGHVVLAGDAAHFWENLRKRAPFPVVADLSATLEGYGKLERLADSADHIIPGHDPLLLESFPKHPLDDQSARVDLPLLRLN